MHTGAALASTSGMWPRYLVRLSVLDGDIHHHDEYIFPDITRRWRNTKRRHGCWKKHVHLRIVNECQGIHTYGPSRRAAYASKEGFGSDLIAFSSTPTVATARRVVRITSHPPTLCRYHIYYYYYDTHSLLNFVPSIHRLGLLSFHFT